MMFLPGSLRGSFPSKYITWNSRLNLPSVRDNVERNFTVFQCFSILNSSPDFPLDPCLTMLSQLRSRNLFDCFLIFCVVFGLILCCRFIGHPLILVIFVVLCCLPHKLYKKCSGHRMFQFGFILLYHVRCNKAYHLCEYKNTELPHNINATLTQHQRNINVTSTQHQLINSTQQLNI